MALTCRVEEPSTASKADMSKSQQLAPYSITSSAIANVPCSMLAIFINFPSVRIGPPAIPAIVPLFDDRG